MIIKVLTIREPYASLILAGIKDVENRTWNTDLRGIFAIHAAKTVCRTDWENAVFDFVKAEDCDEGFARGVIDEVSGGFLGAKYGHIIGVAELERAERFARKSPWHYDGCYGFYLKNPRRFLNPIPATGYLGFWNAELDLDRALGNENKFIGRAIKNGTMGD